MSLILDGSLGTTFNDGSNQSAAASPFGLKNRLINSDMRIDQRNAGASVNITTGANYTLDRWQASYAQISKFTVQQNAGSVTPPVGFSNYLGCTSSSAYSVLTGDFFAINQNIEGFNTADLNWGTANAKTVTLSFWVRSSLTGTFGGSIRNDAGNRSYPFSYTISAANTWEQKSITIAGDTTGTWVGATNGIGLTVYFGLGVGTTYSGTAGAWAGSNFLSATGATSVVGTNGATFYITGVQLEQNTSATPFERRLYGNELALCQRYFYADKPAVTSCGICAGVCFTSGGPLFAYRYPVPMRSAPSLTISAVGDFGAVIAGSAPTATSIALSGVGTTSGRLDVGASVVAGQGCILQTLNANAALNFSAEL